MTEAHFVDTSALVKRYISEPGTQALSQRCFAPDDVEVFVSSLTYAEGYATFARLFRDGRLTTLEHESLIASFERDWASFVVVEYAPPVRRLIPDLAATHSLRGADLIQLATGAYLHTHRALDLFVACDVRLANAAVALGLPLFNPEIAVSQLGDGIRT